MPICIACRLPLKVLYTSYKAADDRTLGRGVRLTQCPRCKQFADKYVEHDFVILFIDLVLLKPGVYRHLLFNRLPQSGGSSGSSGSGGSGGGGVSGGGSGGGGGKGAHMYLAPAIWRLALLLLLFDVYLTWRRIERSDSVSLGDGGGGGTSRSKSKLAGQPVLLQYLFFLALCTGEALLAHGTVRLLAKVLVPAPAPALVSAGMGMGMGTGGASHGTGSATGNGSTLVPGTPSTPSTALCPPPTTNNNASNAPNPISGPAISTALIISSTPQLFPILMVIWNYDVPAAAEAVRWAVVLNNVEALRILLDCGYGVAMVLAVSRVLVGGLGGWVGLRWVGLGEGLGAGGLLGGFGAVGT